MTDKITTPLSCEACGYLSQVFMPIFNKVAEKAMSDDGDAIKLDPQYKALLSLYEDNEHSDDVQVNHPLDRKIMATVLDIANSHFAKDEIINLVPKAPVRVEIINEIACSQDLSGYAPYIRLALDSKPAAPGL